MATEPDRPVDSAAERWAEVEAKYSKIADEIETNLGQKWQASVVRALLDEAGSIVRQAVSDAK